MKAMLHLVDGSARAGGRLDRRGATAAAATTMTPEQMDAAMKASIAAFPAKTEGLGAQVLAPTVLADGTKQFDLTAAGHQVGGLAGQDRRGDGRTTAPSRARRSRSTPATTCRSCCTTSCPSRRRSTSTG